MFQIFLNYTCLNGYTLSFTEKFTAKDHRDLEYPLSIGKFKCYGAHAKLKALKYLKQFYESNAVMQQI